MRSPQLAVLTAVGLCALGIPPGARGDSWERKPPLLTPRRLLAAAVADGKIYTFGGCGSPCFQPPLHTSTFEETRVEVFDPKMPPPNGGWSVKRPIPAILFGAAAATSGKKIYLFGGFVTGDSTYEYTPKTDTWVRKAPMPTPRHGLAAVAVEGKVYVLGGSNGSAPSRALEIYDPAKNTWERGPSMPTARVFLAAAAVGKKIYAIGGSPDCCGESRTAAVEVYDVDGNSWSTAEPLPVALQVSAAATALNGKIYVFGGFIPGSGVQDTTFEYDPATDDWDTKTRLLPPRSGGEPGRDQAQAVALEDGIHLIGGSTDCHCRALEDHDRYVADVPPPCADLRITKTNGLTEVFPRQDIVYTIVVRNVGQVGVLGARVSDTIPRELAVSAWTCAPVTPGAACTVQGPGLGTVDLPVNGRVTFTLSGTVAATARGRLTNCAQVVAACDVTKPVPGKNLDCKSDPIEPCPVPPIVKTDFRTEAMPGDVLSYTITLTNLCPAELPVTVTDSFSTAGQIEVRCPDEEEPLPLPGALHASVVLRPKASVTCRATATVPGTPPCACGIPDHVTNTATVRLVDDPSRSARVEDVDLVKPPPSAGLVVALGVPPEVEDCDLPRTIQVTNQGPCTARDVVLEVEATGDFTLLSLSAPCVAGLPCRLGDLDPDETREITADLEAKSDASCPAEGALNASVVSDCPAPAGAEAAPLGLKVACDLAISKTDGLAKATAGDPLLYTIVATNPGCVTVHDAEVGDIFPSELLGVEWCHGVDCEPAIDSPPPLLDIRDLTPDGSETYLAAGTISPIFVGTLTNTACVTYEGDDADPTPENNCSTDHTDVDLPGPGPGPGPFPIPTTSDYALAALALLLAALALARLRLVG